MKSKGKEKMERVERKQRQRKRGDRKFLIFLVGLIKNNFVNESKLVWKIILQTRLNPYYF